MSLTRRDFFRSGSLLAFPGFFGGTSAQKATSAALRTGALRIGPDIYQSIGVRPFINGTGTLTVNSGSLELPEVRAAMDAAAQHMVQLDELMDRVGARLADLTGAEWGIVTAGCAAAVTHATSACVAGGNPDKHIRLPNTVGLEKDEVIIPKHSRNNYDAAIRAVGVRIQDECISRWQCADPILLVWRSSHCSSLANGWPLSCGRASLPVPRLDRRFRVAEARGRQLSAAG